MIALTLSHTHPILHTPSSYLSDYLPVVTASTLPPVYPPVHPTLSSVLFYSTKCSINPWSWMEWCPSKSQPIYPSPTAVRQKYRWALSPHVIMSWCSCLCCGALVLFHYVLVVLMCWCPSILINISLLCALVMKPDTMIPLLMLLYCVFLHPDALVVYLV